MKKIAHLLFICIVIGYSCASLPKGNPDEKVWLPLFNGKDLSGWDIKIRGHELNDNYNETFIVKDGALTADYSNYENFNETFAHIFYDQPLSYYHLKTEYRFVGEQAPGGPGWAFRNNGLMIHSQSAASMGLDQDFPISIEVQLLGGSGEGERSTANLCTPGTHVNMNGQLHTPHCTNSTSNTFHGDQWVTAEVIALGDSLIIHIVEGDTVMRYTHPQIGGGVVSGYNEVMKEDGQPLTNGYIALQGESHPTQFRKIEVLNLEGCKDPKARNYKSYYVKGNDAACIY